MVWFKPKDKDIDWDEVKDIVKYIVKSRELGFEDKIITRNGIQMKFKRKDIQFAFDTLNKLEKKKMKGGLRNKMAKKEFEPSGDEEDDEEFEDDDESLEEEDDIPPPKIKKQVKEVETKKIPRIKIGNIRPAYQIIGYQVFKGYDENNNEQWIPCDKLSEAETLSGLLDIQYGR